MIKNSKYLLQNLPMKRVPPSLPYIPALIDFYYHWYDAVLYLSKLIFVVYTLYVRMMTISCFGGPSYIVDHLSNRKSFSISFTCTVIIFVIINISHGLFAIGHDICTSEIYWETYLSFVVFYPVYSFYECSNYSNGCLFLLFQTCLFDSLVYSLMFFLFFCCYLCKFR